jgi:hypothetical protein
MNQPHRFVLEFVERNTDEVVDDVPFEVEYMELLCNQIGIDAAKFDQAAHFELDDEDVVRIGQTFGIDIGKSECRVYLRPRRPMDELPYKIHTNRELDLMLNGRKPLAAFVEDYPRETAYEVIPESKFEPYVLSGRFVKREKIYRSLASTDPRRDEARRSIRRVLYAQTAEAWRIDAYLLLHETAELSGWNEGFERMEGTLLGYEQWQNDAYLKMVRARTKK